MPPTEGSTATSSAGSGEQGFQQLPWTAIPKFIPGTTDVTEYTKKLEFLAAMWPKEHLSQLAPRAALLCEGSAFKKVAGLAPDKLKANDVSGVKLLVDTLGGSWGRTAVEQKYETFERAIFGTIQKADETNDSYLARHDIHFEELLAQGVSFEEVRAYILLRQSSLTAEDRKRIVVELDGQLSYKKVCASVRLLGSRFFSDFQGQRGNTKTKTYDAHMVEDAGSEEVERAYQASTTFSSEEPDFELDAEFIEAMIAVEDQDAFQSFEEELEGFFQETPELQEALVSYLEARSRLLAKRKARGFWPAHGSKGSKGGKGFKGKGKGKSAKEQLLQRIAKSHCRACGERGHWKAECPKFGKPGSKSEAGASVAQATVTQAQGPHEDEVFEQLPEEAITLAEAFCAMPSIAGAAHSISPTFFRAEAETCEQGIPETEESISLATRFARLSDASLHHTMAEVEAMTLQEHGQLTITFGTRARGMRFQDLLENNPQYVKWCCEHLADSAKHSQRVFLRYVERVIQQAEEIASNEKELMQPANEAVPKAAGRTLMKSGSKSKAAPRSNPTASDEEDRWDMIHEPTAALQTEVSALNQRMTNMERMLQQLVHHISTQQIPPNVSSKSRLQGIEEEARKVLQASQDVTEYKKFLRKVPWYLLKESSQGSRAIAEGQVDEDRTHPPAYVMFGMYSHGGVTGITSITRQLPSLAQILAAVIKGTQPEHTFATVAVSCNTSVTPHRDSYNSRDVANLVVPLDFPRTGGEIWVAKPPEAQQKAQSMLCNGQWISDSLVSLKGSMLLDPHMWHASAPWTGNRTLLVGFALQTAYKLSTSEAENLQGLGFVLPPSVSAKEEILNIKEELSALRKELLSAQPLVQDSQWPPAAVAAAHACADAFCRAQVVSWDVFQDSMLTYQSPLEAQIDLLEVSTRSDSRLTDVINESGGKARRFTNRDGDLNTVEGQRALWDTLQRTQPKHVWLSPDARHWSPWTRLNAARDSRYQKNLLDERQREQTVLQLLVKIFEWQKQNGRNVPSATNSVVAWMIRCRSSKSLHHPLGALPATVAPWRISIGARSTADATTEYVCLGKDNRTTMPSERRRMRIAAVRSLITVFAQTKPTVSTPELPERTDVQSRDVTTPDLEGWAPPPVPLHGPAFRSLTSEEKCRLRRIHNNLGHPSPETLARHLKAANESPSLIEAALDFQCDVCLESTEPRHQRPSKLPEPRDFNDLIGIDGFFFKSQSGYRAYAIHALDEASCFRAPSRLGDHAKQALNDFWISWAGPPKQVYLDPAGEFRCRARRAFLEADNSQAIRSKSVIWLAHGTNIIRAAPENLRPASLREWQNLSSAQLDEPWKNVGGASTYTDLTGVSPADPEQTSRAAASSEGAILMPQPGVSVNPPGNSDNNPDEISQPEQELTPQVSQEASGVERDPNLGAAAPSDTPVIESSMDNAENLNPQDIPVPESDEGLVSDHLFVAFEDSGIVDDQGAELINFTTIHSSEEATGPPLAEDELPYILDPLKPNDHQAYCLEVPLKAKDVRKWIKEGASEHLATVAAASKKSRAEVHLKDLTVKEKELFEKAKEKEISCWLQTSAIRPIMRKKLNPEQILRSRWILTWKAPEEGETQQRAKARLVVLGYQDPKLTEVLRDAPTLSREGRSLVLQTISSRRFRLGSFDIKTAFLRGKADAENPLAMDPPRELRKALNLKEEEVCELLGNAYGRVDAPLLFYKELSSQLAQLGFIRHPLEPCVFLLYSPGKQLHGILGMHVDDGVCGGDKIFSQNIEALQKTLPFGSRKFDRSTFTGIHLEQRADYSIKASQSEYVRNIPQLDIGRSRRLTPEAEITEGERSRLRGLVGSLQYAVTHSRPDMAAKLGEVQSSIPKATVQTLMLANKVLRETQEHHDVSIQFLPIDPGVLTFVSFGDASFASSKSLSSHQGALICATNGDLLANREAPLCPLSWSSKKIPRVVRSTLSAEAYAMSKAVDMLGWMRALWGTVHVPSFQWQRPEEGYRQLNRAAIITDCKSLYDLVTRLAMPSCEEFRTTLEVLLIKQRCAENTTFRLEGLREIGWKTVRGTGNPFKAGPQKREEMLTCDI
ncbi:Copia protein [Symbiodinium microadriaticum]|uniref:Copia protein n=1 Tax=Symbiodinium microadriaticum TaxID=2951 RepID=A0A1Q9EH37_SYMMI|nr:Copia protein [Symbiodinium microadriaticum]